MSRLFDDTENANYPGKDPVEACYRAQRVRDDDGPDWLKSGADDATLTAGAEYHPAKLAAMGAGRMNLPRGPWDTL